MRFLAENCDIDHQEAYSDHDGDIHRYSPNDVCCYDDGDGHGDGNGHGDGKGWGFSWHFDLLSYRQALK